MNTTILRKIGSGLECDVYDCGEGVCYKQYRNRSRRWLPQLTTVRRLIKIYQNAKLAAQEGLGPEVYGRDSNGYFTEIVKTFNCHMDHPDCSMICEECVLGYTADEREYLAFSLQELFGIEIEDLHSGNIGRKDGKLICIDFGIGISVPIPVGI